MGVTIAIIPRLVRIEMMNSKRVVPTRKQLNQARFYINKETGVFKILSPHPTKDYHPLNGSYVNIKHLRKPTQYLNNRSVKEVRQQMDC